MPVQKPHPQRRPGVAAVLPLAAAAALCGTAGTAQAQFIDRGFIAPHEYALPVEFKPFNIFAHYAILQQGDRYWDNGGNKVTGDRLSALLGVTKFVRLWTPESNPKLGLAWEIIVPTVGIRNRTNGAGSVNGVGDPITGPAFWIKPAPNWTLGGDLFLQVPIGSNSVSTKSWNVIGSVFWDGQFDKINYTGNLGYNIPGSPNTGAPKLGLTWHSNNRLGYRATGLLEPYVGIDYIRQQSAAGNPTSHETALAAGVLFHTYAHSSIALHYERGIRGQNRMLQNSLNMRFAYVF